MSNMSSVRISQAQRGYILREDGMETPLVFTDECEMFRWIIERFGLTHLEVMETVGSQDPAVDGIFGSGVQPEDN
jgi:hypothetical protein